MSTDPRFATVESQAQVIAALEHMLQQTIRDVRHMQSQLSTLGTPWWRRILFRLDGWPAWWVVATHPQWRPWRRWWRS